MKFQLFFVSVNLWLFWLFEHLKAEWKAGRFDSENFRVFVMAIYELQREFLKLNIGLVWKWSQSFFKAQSFFKIQSFKVCFKSFKFQKNFRPLKAFKIDL